MIHIMQLFVNLPKVYAINLKVWKPRSYVQNKNNQEYLVNKQGMHRLVTIQARSKHLFYVLPTYIFTPLRVLVYYATKITTIAMRSGLSPGEWDEMSYFESSNQQSFPNFLHPVCVSTLPVEKSLFHLSNYEHHCFSSFHHHHHLQHTQSITGNFKAFIRLSFFHI